MAKVFIAALFLFMAVPAWAGMNYPVPNYTGAFAGQSFRLKMNAAFTEISAMAVQKSMMGAANGVASLNGSSKVAEDPANATATPTAGKIPLADGSGTLNAWITGLAASLITSAPTGILKGAAGAVGAAAMGDADLILPDQTGNNGKMLQTNGTTANWVTLAGGGNVTGPVSSVDGTLATFLGTSGTEIQQNTTTGILKGASGVVNPAAKGDADLILPEQTGQSGKVLTTNGSATSWTSVGGTGTVTDVSVNSANGFGGTVVDPTTTPAIDITTSVTGIIKGDGTAVSAAAAGTDYQAPITYQSTTLSGDVALFLANIFYDGPSLSLPAGTYWISANFVTTATNGTHKHTAKIWNGASLVVCSGQNNGGGTNAASYTFNLGAYVTLTGTNTIKVSVASTGTSGLIRAACPDNGAGNNASRLIAIKIGP